MSVKSLKNIFVHIAALVVILWLLLLIWRFKSNEFDHLIAQEIDELCPVVLENVRSYNMWLKDDIVTNSIEYRNPTNELYAQRACWLYAHVDTLMLVPPQSGILTDFGHLITEVTDSDAYIIRDLKIGIPEMPGKKQTYFSKVDIMLIQLQIALMETTAMNYFLAKVSGTGGGFDRVQPVIRFTDFGQTKGDTVRVDVVAGAYMPEVYAEMRFNLEGRELSFKDGAAHFERVFPKSGIYPLKASISARKLHSDSLCTWEKTFYLKVQE